MRIALVCRDLGRDRLVGPGAHTFATGMALAEAGHEVLLVSEELAPVRARHLGATGTPTWVPVPQTRPDHRYFTDQQAYADRVYDTLRLLSAERALDVVDFIEAGGEAVTALRAKRLLGEFSGTLLVVTRSPWATAGRRPTRFPDALTWFGEQYCRERADALLECLPTPEYEGRGGRVVRARIAGPTPQGIPRPAAPRPAAARLIWYLGDPRPDTGFETFLAAAELVLDRHPDARFIVRGDIDGQAGEDGAYGKHPHRRCSLRLRDAIRFDGPLRLDDVASIPPSGTQCVLPAGAAACPTAALLAMAAGHIVVAMAGSVAAGLVADRSTGRIVSAEDPAALAAVLADGIERPSAGAALALSAASRVRTEHSPAAVAESLATVYARSGVRPARRHRTGTGRVSAIIPVYNQGRYLRQAVQSIRSAGPGDVEIVVVDDGSTDPETLAAVDGLDGVTTLRQPNLGLSAARNAGLRACTGAYVVPLDADDLLPAEFAGHAVDALRRDRELAYVTGYVRNFGLIDHVYVPFGYVPGMSLLVNTLARATGVFRRDALEAVGGYDEELPAFEDWDLYIRLHESGRHGDIVPVEGHRYRRHQESMTLSATAAERIDLSQRLLRKHAGGLPSDEVLPLLLSLVHLWKTGYEPSASVLLQRGPAPGAPDLTEAARAAHRPKGGP